MIRRSRLEKRIKADMNALEQRLSDAISVAPSAASTTGARAQGSGLAPPSVSGPNPQFMPTKVEIKGFITSWSDRETQGVTKMEAMTWIANLMTKLPEDVRPLVDIRGTERLNAGFGNTKIQVKVTEGES